MASDFVHLHVHSDYSVLDGACKVKQLLDRCEQYGMEACALTDHGNLFGAVEFYQAAKKRGIKPIIGAELYLAPESRFDKEPKYLGRHNSHCLLLCENETGYHNLCKLSSKGYLEGFYYKPRIDEEILFAHRHGLIATTACLAGRVPRAILQDDVERAEAEMLRFIEIFGKDHFLVELMDHGIPDQGKVNPVLVELARKHDLTLIATNDCHYLDKADAEAHEALLAIQTQTTLEDEGRFRFSTSEFHFKSPEEMAAGFTQWPEAITNTVKVAERCNVEIPLGESLIPKYDTPDDKAPELFLRELVMQGLAERYDPVPEAYRERAEYELGIIEHMRFVDYFLVVWDLINHARKEGIPVGPGRGSGAGSIVAYALHITNIDPMRYQLLFERFLNPERVSMPDFDIDFCYNRREEMIEYSYEKYGRENVSQIITFGRMLAKNVIRNVGRVLGMNYGEVDRIAKLVPDELKITLADALKKEPQLQQLINGDSRVAKLWELATRLEGTISNCGTHAAGVVICDHDLTDHVALFKAGNSETVATQVEMKCVEEVGLLKMDFLGLRTLTVVHDAVRLIRENRGIDIDIDALEPNDEKTYALLRSGRTTGIFQLESSGMRELAKRIGLESLEEMSALVALYRPGPMEFIDSYVESKYHPEKITYDHPLLEPILKETYGIAVYQEQVMQMVQTCGGFSLGQADIVRRAMGKKKLDLLEEQKVKFIEGCAERDIEKELALKIWDKIFAFAGYGFNKSHSVAYAFVAYQTAYLKANFPVEFMCALLTSESGNLDKVALYVEECRRLNIKVLSPDVNRSETDFTVVGDDICFGMSAIKNVGEEATRAIVAERIANGPFSDIFDFCTRLDTRMVNRRCIESLNRAGAFQSTGWNRRQVENVLDQALAEAQTARRDRDAGQTSLFDMEGMADAVETMHVKPDLLEWPDHELLQYEKEMLGLYVSGHPLLKFASILRRYNTLDLAEFDDLKEGRRVNIGGLIGQVKIHVNTRNEKMAFLTLETLEGSCEITAFSDIFEQKSGLLAQDMIVMIDARVNYRNGAPGLLVNDVYPIEETERHLSRAVHVRIRREGLAREKAEELAALIDKNKGTCDVFLHVPTSTGKEALIHATSVCRAAATPALRAAIERLPWVEEVYFSAGHNLPTHHPRREAPPSNPAGKNTRPL